MTVQRDADEQTGSEAERRALWSEVRVDPVEIALPKGVGYTLRAYRPIDEVTPTDVSQREVDEFPQRPRPTFDDDEDALTGEFDDEFGDGFEDEEEPDDGSGDDFLDEEDLDEEEPDDASDDASADALDNREDDEDEDELANEPDEVPVFLGRAGRLYLFRSVEGLVDFVRSGEEHDMTQLDTWPDLVERITPEDVVPLDEDSYELDLVVENLRGGRDSWDSGLIIQAGEVARDLGYALRLTTVIGSLGPDSPLDDLDEALRATESGGIGGFLAKRRLRKIGAEAAPLGWRTIIGKISGVVDWRD